MLIVSFTVSAQNYRLISHNSGTEVIYGTSIKVTKHGNPSAGKGFCGISGYWIGYGASNAYTFTFSTPAKHLRLRLTAINTGEMISISVNGKQYFLTKENTTTFQGECLNIPPVSLSDGKILGDCNYTNAEVHVKVPAIDSITIAHENGKNGGAGTVFDIAIVDESTNTGQDAGNGSTGISNLVLQPGMFYMLPNPAGKMVNLAFLPSSNGTATVTITDMAGRKVLLQAFDCNKGAASQLQLDVERFVPGNYMVELNLNEEHYVEKLVKL